MDIGLHAHMKVTNQLSTVTSWLVERDDGRMVVASTDDLESASPETVILQSRILQSRRLCNCKQRQCSTCNWTTQTAFMGATYRMALIAILYYEENQPIIFFRKNSSLLLMTNISYPPKRNI